ncbi:ABC transporter ATP-binding protein YvcR [Olavius sp. associated proteobacterium Delta 1]|nr:ABC transporter ATP-binding protein YvcR [Olavius sp. associated proteobacterium Delta 1]
MQSENTQPVIAAKKLTRIYSLGYSEVAGINHLNFEIAAGELVVLKGESGSGKSTLLSLLAGLDRPTSGELTVADHNLTRASATDLTHFRREVVGMVFQSFNLMPTLNVLENACLPGLLAGKPFHDIKSKAMEFIDWLGLNSRLTHLPAQLSGGEMQRTAIARALINDPAIVLADEPTGNLDSRNGQVVIELLAELNRKGKQTVIIATHSTLADALATNKITLKDGMITDEIGSGARRCP